MNSKDIDLLEAELQSLRESNNKNVLNYIKSIGDLNYRMGKLEGMLISIVDWAYRQEDKPEWLDGAEGILSIDHNIPKE
jgi:hypothetical protein